MKLSADLARLVEIISILRGPQGCAWDKDQDLRSMRPYLLEEVHETLEAMDLSHLPGSDDSLEEELGDLLFVVLMLCQICKDEERFDLDSTCRRISEKMVVRHPHVFGPEKGKAPGGSIAAWEAEKAKSKPRKSRLDGVPLSLPSLLRAHRQGEKAAAVGFDWPDIEGVFDKMREELTELEVAIKSGEQDKIFHEYGDLLLATSNLGRHLDTPPESALREANNRFGRRFRCMENYAKQNGEKLTDLGPEALDSLWEKAKAEEDSPASAT